MKASSKKNKNDSDDGDDKHCWNRFAVSSYEIEYHRFRQCKNVATWFYYDDSAAKADPSIEGAVCCQLCDECYNNEKVKPESETVFDMDLFRRRK